MATITVPILEIRKLKFKGEKLGNLPKITQLISVELRFEPDYLGTKIYTHNHAFFKKEMGRWA